MAKKQYYYTCPIKALYMMKEFGVRVYVKLENKVTEKFMLLKNQIIYFNRKMAI